MFLPRRQLLKIGLITGFVVLVGVLVIFGKPVGSTFANHSGTGGIQLTIDSYSIYNNDFQSNLSWELKDLVPIVDRFFDFDDIKPGDSGLNTISIHLEENPAYVCMDFTNLDDQENGTNEPESLVDTLAGGELSAGIEFFAWRDDGDNTFEVGERPLFGTTPEAAVVVLNDTTHPLSDATTAEVFQPGETYYVGIVWCAGALDVDLATGEVLCDADTLGNEYQTDSFTVDVSLRAVEASSFANYQCVEPSEPKVDLYLSKNISGVNQGFELSDFSYRIRGENTDIIAPHDSFTSLAVGSYTIEELVPAGFVKQDWRIGWWGQCDNGDKFTTTITIEERHIKYRTLYCQADNQFRPETNPNGHGIDSGGETGSDTVVNEDVQSDSDVSPQPQASGESGGRQNQRWSRVETPSGLFSNLRSGARR